MKVIDLLSNLESEVGADGHKEAAAYQEFACFCKDTTELKSTSITTGRDNIATLSSDIEEKTADKEVKSTEKKERMKAQGDLNEQLTKARARCEKEHLEYEAEAADLTKA